MTKLYEYKTGLLQLKYPAGTRFKVIHRYLSGCGDMVNLVREDNNSPDIAIAVKTSCLAYYFDEVKQPKNLSWKQVLYCTAIIGYTKMLEMTQTSGYKYFVWNGRVLDLNGNETGLLEKDVK